MSHSSQYSLRKRNLSSNALGQIEEETIDHGQHKGQDPDLSSQTVDKPVVNMEDFETVGTDEKLNLLMSAINKINTSFHMKIENLERKITNEVNSLSPKITVIESAVEELQARIG